MRTKLTLVNNFHQTSITISARVRFLSQYECHVSLTSVQVAKVNLALCDGNDCPCRMNPRFRGSQPYLEGMMFFQAENHIDPDTDMLVESIFKYIKKW
jgi:hypothetical protein